ncbi:MAG: putative chaperone protein [Candidatus Azotimanducaceae bacterium]
MDVVIRTGGSSQIAAVRRLLDQRFEGKVTAHDPFTSVAAGLAIASYHGYEFVE